MKYIESTGLTFVAVLAVGACGDDGGLWLRAVRACRRARRSPRSRMIRPSGCGVRARVVQGESALGAAILLCELGRSSKL